jgi:hypothetical protein
VKQVKQRPFAVSICRAGLLAGECWWLFMASVEIWMQLARHFAPLWFYGDLHRSVLARSGYLDEMQ